MFGRQAGGACRPMGAGQRKLRHSKNYGGAHSKLVRRFSYFTVAVPPAAGACFCQPMARRLPLAVRKHR